MSLIMVFSSFRFSTFYGPAPGATNIFGTGIGKDDRYERAKLMETFRVALITSSSIDLAPLTE